MTWHCVPALGCFGPGPTLCSGTDAARTSGPRGLAEVRHDLAGKEFHRPADLVLGQATEVHPAEDLADTELLHLLDVAGHRLGRAEGQRAVGEQGVPGDLAEGLRQLAERGLQARMCVLNALGNDE